jgi:GGDEF domain-containing protein
MFATSIPAVALLIVIAAISLLLLAVVLRDRTRGQLRERVRLDAKTGAPNRAAWDTELSRELARSRCR